MTKQGFSSIQLLPDSTFQSVLGRFNSFNCTGPGAYIGSISYSIIQQNMTVVSATGCDSGSVDLQESVYKWQAGEVATCPDGNAKTYQLNRAATSQT